LKRDVKFAGIALAAFILASSTLAGASPQARLDARVGGGGASPRHATTVIGSAWNQDNTPIAAARVQLRNLDDAKVVATAVADEGGKFTFTDIEPGTYAVELVGANGKIVTVGQAFVIARGETVATFVRIGSKAPWFAGFFNNAAGAVAAAAASQGVTALAPVQLPRSSSGGGRQ
jgi:hypothetical protein